MYMYITALYQARVTLYSIHWIIVVTTVPTIHYTKEYSVGYHSLLLQATFGCTFVLSV